MVTFAGASSVALLTGLLLWAPLPFGSATPQGVVILEIVAFVGLALASAGAKLDPRGRTGHKLWNSGVTAPTLALAGVALLGIAQSMSWSPGLVASLSPGHASLQEGATQTLALSGNPGATATLSLAPSESRGAAFVWMAVAACFVTAVLGGRARNHRRLFAVALLTAALIQVFYGMATLGTGFIWGIDVPHDPDRLRGSFVNPDHFALFLEVSLATVFAWGWWAFRRSRREALSDRLVKWIAPPVSLWLILFVGVAFSGSRAGLMAALAGVCVQGFLVAWMLRSWRGGLIGVGAAVMGFAAVAFISFQQGFGRWLATSAHELSWNHRLMVYEATLELWHRFTWVGTGLGTFQEAFTLVQPPELPRLWSHAHNDYLELLATTGVVGVMIVVPALLFLASRLVGLLRRGERSEDRAAALAALGALAAAVLHSCFDFGLTTPANAAVFAIVCGAAAGAPQTD